MKHRTLSNYFEFKNASINYINNAFVYMHGGIRMKYSYPLLLSFFSLVLVSCSANIVKPNRIPTENEMINAFYGEQPNKIEDYIRGSTFLKDPLTAIINIHDVSRGYSSFWDQVTFGWCVTYEINARNSYGGYTGFSTEQILFFWDNNQLKNPMSSECTNIPESVNNILDKKDTSSLGSNTTIMNAREGSFQKLDRTQLSYTKELYGVRPAGNIFFKGDLENGEPVVLISVIGMNSITQGEFNQILISKNDYAKMKDHINKFFKWEKIAKSNNDTITKEIGTIDTRISFFGLTSSYSTAKRKKISGKAIYTFTTETPEIPLKPEDKIKYFLKIEQKGNGTSGEVYFDHNSLEQLVNNLDLLFNKSTTNNSKNYDLYK